MTYISSSSIITAGYELECHGLRPIHIERELQAAGIDWVKVTTDATSGVDAELPLPPMPHDGSGGALLDMQQLFSVLERAGCRVVRRACGGHVHIGNQLVINMSPSEYWEASKSAMRDTGRFYTPPTRNLADAMPIALVKDVIRRYAAHQDDINALLSPSRRDNRYAQQISRLAAGGRDHAAFEAADNIRDIDRIMGGKFQAVALHRWQSGTIEFRQHQATMDAEKLFAWCKLIGGLFVHSDRYRLDYDNMTASTIVQTDERHYRAGCRMDVTWQIIRRDGGATVQQIMDATGCSSQRIRAMISEMRGVVGDDAIICHTQQSYGHSYGSSNGTHDLSGYEMLREISREASGMVALLPDNRIGATSIYASIDDATFEYLNARRLALA